MFSNSAHREGMPSLEGGGGYELINQHGGATPWRSTSKSTKAWFFGIIALYVILLTGDGVVGAILFDVYTEIYSQYLNQATAFVYCVWSSLAVWWLKRNRKPMTAATDDEVSAPWSVLVFIGCLNGSANFFQGTGMPHTSGLSQSLLLVLSLPAVSMYSSLRHGEPRVECNFGGPFEYPIEGFEGYGADLDKEKLSISSDDENKKK